MSEIRFEFGEAGEISGSLHYSREARDGGRLSVRFTAMRLRHPDGSARTFALDFNNIGNMDPLFFLESLDQGYLRDKLTNLSAQSLDLFKTVENVRRVLEEEEHDLEPDQVEAVERAIDLAAETFAGDRRSACEGLIRALGRMELPCFQDDPFHLIGSRRTLEGRLFERIVWPGLLMTIEGQVSRDPDLDARIGAIVAGVAQPGTDPEDDWLEPGSDF